MSPPCPHLDKDFALALADVLGSTHIVLTLSATGQLPKLSTHDLEGASAGHQRVPHVNLEIAASLSKSSVCSDHRASVRKSDRRSDGETKNQVITDTLSPIKP